MDIEDNNNQEAKFKAKVKEDAGVAPEGQEPNAIDIINALSEAEDITADNELKGSEEISAGLTGVLDKLLDAMVNESSFNTLFAKILGKKPRATKQGVQGLLKQAACQVWDFLKEAIVRVTGLKGLALNFKVQDLDELRESIKLLLDKLKEGKDTPFNRALRKALDRILEKLDKVIDKELTAKKAPRIQQQSEQKNEEPQKDQQAQQQESKKEPQDLEQTTKSDSQEKSKNEAENKTKAENEPEKKESAQVDAPGKTERATPEAKNLGEGIESAKANTQSEKTNTAADELANNPAKEPKTNQQQSEQHKANPEHNQPSKGDHETEPNAANKPGHTDSHDNNTAHDNKENAHAEPQKGNDHTAHGEGTHHGHHDTPPPAAVDPVANNPVQPQADLNDLFGLTGDANAGPLTSVKDTLQEKNISKEIQGVFKEPPPKDLNPGVKPVVNTPNTPKDPLSEIVQNLKNSGIKNKGEVGSTQEGKYTATTTPIDKQSSLGQGMKK